MDPSQSCITDYFHILEKVAFLIKVNKVLYSELLQAQQAQDETPQVEMILQKMLKTAQDNISKFSNQRRHESLIVKFAISLFLYSGPMAYNLLYSNMPNALPSLRTVQRKVNAEYKIIKEGSFRFDELQQHLQTYNCPPYVTIGEDATRLVAMVDYDKNTDCLVGFVLPVDDNGLPIQSSYLATSFSAIETYFKTATIAKHAFLYMAQPLKPSTPAFILVCLCTDNKFTAEHVLKRWTYIRTECEKRGITVASYGADGDSRELKSMRITSGLLLKPSESTHAALSPS